MKRTIKTVDLADIRIDGGTQMRVSVSPEWIQGMVDNMKNGVEYPDVEARFDGTHYWLTDGFHRYHAQCRLGLKKFQVSYLPGTQEDAIRDARKANTTHGLPLNREDKVNKVKIALQDPLLADWSDAEIAKECEVSKSFVGAIRRPEVREKQKENMKRHVQKKAREAEQADEAENSLTTPEVPSSLTTGAEPDEAELRANEAQREADMEAVAKFLDADDKMKHLYEENQRLLSANVGLRLRITELMNEKSAAVKMVKQLQKENEKLKGKK